jgi:hypothetical protein
MENEPRIAQIFKSLNAGTLLELVAIIAGAVLLIVAVQRLLPWLAGHLHGRKRLNLLAVMPLARLLVIIMAVGLSVPLLIEPSMQNMVALLGTVGLALGFALKAYPVDSAQQFQFVSDLTVRGKAALSRLGVEFAAVPAMAQTP